MSFLVVICAPAHASLVDRGSFFYDDVSNLSWMKDWGVPGIRYNQANAIAWADDLSYGGFDDWFLPTMDQLLGFSAQIYNFTYTTLLTNLNTTGYWSSSLSPTHQGAGMILYPHFANATFASVDSLQGVVGVRVGDVGTVAEGSSLALSALALAAMALAKLSLQRDRRARARLLAQPGRRAHR
jgi:hypothetical protein